MKLVRVCIVLLCGALAMPLAAAETWYQVEVIVLAQRNPDVGDEGWPATVLPTASGTVLTIPDGSLPLAQNARIAPVAPENLRLAGTARRIATNGNYELLLHTGWRQPGLSRDQALPVRIRSGLSPDAGGTSQPRLDGTVRLSVARVLQFETDLRYRDPLAAPHADQTSTPHIYRMAESRRMRSKELHYLDHPMFGVIVLVTPL